MQRQIQRENTEPTLTTPTTSITTSTTPSATASEPQSQTNSETPAQTTLQTSKSRNLPKGKSEHEAQLQEHAKTQALLAQLLEKIEAQEAQIAAHEKKKQALPPQSEDRLKEFLGGKVNGILSLVGNANSLLPLLLPLVPFLLRFFPSLPQLSTNIVATLLPVVVLTGMTMAATLLARKFPRRSTRIKYCRGLMYAYGGAMTVYLCLLSCTFLQHDNWVSGCLATIAGFNVYFSIRKIGKETGELTEDLKQLSEGE
jgi:hypothetical protein